MKRDTFFKLNNILNSVKDIEVASRRFKVPEDVLYSIYSQKIVRNTKKDFYVVQRQAHSMLREWKRGKSLLEIAECRKFSPVLTASFILKSDGMTKKQFKDMMHNCDDIRKPRLKKEMKEVIDADIIYSPRGIENQKNRGFFCEDQIQTWLDGKGIGYYTEEESRALEREKTPDFLLRDDVTYGGMEVKWFESKGSFGSPYQTRHDYDNQLSHYVKLFGPGIVSYWLGYVDDITMGEEIVMIDRSFFKD